MTSNKGQIVLLCALVIQLSSSSISMGDEIVTRLQLLNENWKESTVFDQNRFVRQMELIDKTDIRSGIILPPQEQLKVVADILWGELDKMAKEEGHLKNISICPSPIPGYFTFDRPPVVVEPKNQHDASFQVDVSQFEKLLPPLPNNNKDITGGHIRVYLACYADRETARSLVLFRILFGNMMASDYLSLYKIDNGPGDACLVSVSGRPKQLVLSDRRVAFVRGNIAVYLVSRYANFGCMDLACRIDAWLVEQMKKQQAAEKMKQKEVKPQDTKS